MRHRSGRRALLMFLTLLPMTALTEADSHVKVVNIAEPAENATIAATLYNNGTVGAAYNGASYSSETDKQRFFAKAKAGRYRG